MPRARSGASWPGPASRTASRSPSRARCSSKSAIEPPPRSGSSLDIGGTSGRAGAGVNELGQAWEELACSHLQAAGLALLARNFRTRFGELDLVMREAGVLVFVEVRYRANNDYGGAAA